MGGSDVRQYARNDRQSGAGLLRHRALRSAVAICLAVRPRHGNAVGGRPRTGRASIRDGPLLPGARCRSAHHGVPDDLPVELGVSTHERLHARRGYGVFRLSAHAAGHGRVVVGLRGRRASPRRSDTRARLRLTGTRRSRAPSDLRDGGTVPRAAVRGPGDRPRSSCCGVDSNATAGVGIGRDDSCTAHVVAADRSRPARRTRRHPTSERLPVLPVVN